jgi:hypothetical protein
MNHISKSVLDTQKEEVKNGLMICFWILKFQLLYYVRTFSSFLDTSKQAVLVVGEITQVPTTC